MLQQELMAASMAASMTSSVGPISPQTTLPPPPPPHQNNQMNQVDLRRRDRSTSRSRPVSILHKPAPLIEPQPS